MKSLKFLFVALALVSLKAQAEVVEASQDETVNISQIDGHSNIPKVGTLIGSVVSVYAGSAYGLERYYVNIGNAAVECEGDDCIEHKVFEVAGRYEGVAQQVTARQIDKNTYAVSFVTKKVFVDEERGTTSSKKVKVVVTTKFNAQGLEPKVNVKDVF